MSEEVSRHLDDRTRADILSMEYELLRRETISRTNGRLAIVGFVVALASFVASQSNIPFAWRGVVTILAVMVSITAWFRLGRLIKQCSARVVILEQKVNATCGEELLVWGSQVATRRPFHRVWMILLAAVLVGICYCAYIALSPPGREDTIDEATHPERSPVAPVKPMETFRAAWDSEARADWPVAELLASMSEQAYLSPVEAEASYRTLGFDRFTAVVEGSMIGYVASEKDVTVIAFRGTNAGEMSDWLVNLNCRSISTPHGAIHRGFYNAYQSLEPQIVALLGKRKPKHLWITGHSLGGAIALVCAYDLIENKWANLDGIITFGQPMVAGQQLAKHLDNALLGRYAHFVNEADIVPRVPPSHTYCGSEVWFTAHGVKRSKPKRTVYGAAQAGETASEDTKEIVPLSRQEFEELQAELRKQNTEPDRLPDGRPILKGNSPWIRDHSIELYLQKIRSLLGGSK